VRLKELGDAVRRGVGVVHPDGQRLKAFEHRPGVERADRRTGVAHQLLHRTVDVLLVAQDRPAEHAALTVDVLGARVHHHVGAQRETLLQ
jgi:NADH dehydrogenase